MSHDFKSEAELEKTTVPVRFLQQELSPNPSGCRGALFFLSSLLLLRHLPRSLRCLFSPPPCCHLSLLESRQPAVSTTPSPLAAAAAAQMRWLTELLQAQLHQGRLRCCLFAFIYSLAPCLLVVGGASGLFLCSFVCRCPTFSVS